MSSLPMMMKLLSSIVRPYNRRHDAKKMLDTRVLPEKQEPQIQAKQVVKIRPKLGRDRVGIRHKNPKLLLT